MRGMLVAAVAMAVVSSAASAGVIAQWNFNGPGAAGTTAPNIGAGILAGVGGVSNAVNVPGSPTDPWLPAGENWAFTTAGYATQGTGSGTRGIGASSSTAGFGGVMVSFDQRNSGTASRYWQFQYTLDGAEYTSAGLAADGVYELVGTNWASYTMDLSGIVGVADSAVFGFRMVAVFGPSGTYAASGNGNYATNGTARWDMVTVTGSEIPGPGAACLVGMACALRRGRRRR